MKRRKFIRIGAIGGLSLHWIRTFGQNFGKNTYALPNRVLGQTGEKISVVGFGGIALRNNGQVFANETIAKAFDLGVTYFDIAPSYGDAQSLLGPALEPYRNKVFLACKTMERDRAGSEQELNESLRQLKTDHIDLYQFHALSKMEDLEEIFAPGGAIETFMKARKDGKIRYIGFSAHDENVALKAIDLFDFDTILFPINCVCWLNGNFGPAVFEKSRKKNMGVLAIKAVAKTHIGDAPNPYPNMWYRPYEKENEIMNSLRFTLSKDLTATVHAGDVRFMEKTIQAVRTSPEMIPPDKDEIAAMVKDVTPIFSNK